MVSALLGWIVVCATFIFLTNQIINHQAVVALDEQLMRMVKTLQETHHLLLLVVFSWITLLGNAYTVTLVTTIAFLVGYTRHAYAYTTGLLVSVVGAVLSSYLLKLMIERPRPTHGVVEMIETTFSYPSAHAAIAIALYGFLGYWVWHKTTSIGSRLAIGTITALVAVGIGISRLYLGVHFPSDVIAGYLLGILWLIAGISMDQSMRLSIHQHARD